MLNVACYEIADNKDEGKIMKNWFIGLLLIVLGAAAYYYVTVYKPSTIEVAPIQLPAVVIEQPEPAPVEWAEEIIEPEPELEWVEEVIVLPELAESDESVLESLSDLTGDASLRRFFVSDNVVSRFVATVDSLTSRQVPGQIMIVQDLDGTFVASADEQAETIIRSPEGDPIPQFILNPANYQRYEAQVAMFEALDAQELANLYRHYAPLLQEAYVDLGYPDGDFDARLIEVIDSLLATPDLKEPPRLVKPEAFYLFADPTLEGLPAGQKILLRMGPLNAQHVKAKLQEIRTALK